MKLTIPKMAVELKEKDLLDIIETKEVNGIHSGLETVEVKPGWFRVTATDPNELRNQIRSAANRGLYIPTELRTLSIRV